MFDTKAFVIVIIYRDLCTKKKEMGRGKGNTHRLILSKSLILLPCPQKNPADTCKKTSETPLLQRSQSASLAYPMGLANVADSMTLPHAYKPSSFVGFGALATLESF